MHARAYRKVQSTTGRQEEFESPQAVEERKRVKREKMAIEQARRQSEKRRRDAERLDLLAALARLSPADRLSRFATDPTLRRSEEHTSELQSLMRISYAVFCLKKQTHIQRKRTNSQTTTRNNNTSTGS